MLPLSRRKSRSADDFPASTSASKRRGFENLERRHSVAVPSSNETLSGNNMSRSFSTGFRLFRDKAIARDEDVIIEKDIPSIPSLKSGAIPRTLSSSSSNSAESGESGTRSDSTTRTTPPSTPTTRSSGLTVVVAGSPVADEVKRAISRGEVKQALQTLNIVSEAANVVLKELEDVVQRYTSWRSSNQVLLSSTSIWSHPRFTECARCERRRIINTVMREGGVDRMQEKIAQLEELEHIPTKVAERRRLMAILARKEVLRREQLRKEGVTNDAESMLRKKKRVKGKEQAVDVPELFEEGEWYYDEDTNTVRFPSPSPSELSDTTLCPNSRRRCENCPGAVTRCPFLHPRYGPFFSSASSAASGSEPCCIPTKGTDGKNDMHHLTLSHLALKYTLSRTIDSAGLSRQKTLLRLAETVLFGLKPFMAAIPFDFNDIRETVTYWLDFSRVKKDWAWINPFDEPSDLDAVRKLCKQRIEKVGSKDEATGVLDEFAARLIDVGPSILFSELCRAYWLEDSLGFQIFHAIEEGRARLGKEIRREGEEEERKKWEKEDQIFGAGRRKRTGEIVDECFKGVICRTRSMMDRLRR